MKHLILSIAASIAVLASSAQNRSYLPQWQNGYMDIHFLATGRGESTFIIMPDGTKMLIDAGDVGPKWSCPILPDTSKTAGEWISTYINHFAAPTPTGSKVDYFLLSHFHSDHMGNRTDMVAGDAGYGLSGITMVGEHIGFGKIVDRGYPDYDFPTAEAIHKATGGFIDDYRSFISVKGIPCEKFDVGSSRQFCLQNDAGKYSDSFRIVNLAGNGEVWTGEEGASRPAYKGAPERIEENAFSCAIRIDYGPFRYYTGGDLTGGWWKSTPEKEPKERDFETPTARMCGPVTVAKVNHHGWSDAANSFFIETLQAKVWLISSSDKSQPKYFTLRRLYDNMTYDGWREMFCTSSEAEISNPKPSHFKDMMKAIGHIVVRVYEGGKSWQIYVIQNDDPTYPLIYRSEIRETK